MSYRQLWIKEEDCPDCGKILVPIYDDTQDRTYVWCANCGERP